MSNGSNHMKKYTFIGKNSIGKFSENLDFCEKKLSY